MNYLFQYTENWLKSIEGWPPDRNSSAESAMLTSETGPPEEVELGEASEEIIGRLFRRQQAS